MMTAVVKRLDTVKVEDKLADLRLRDFEERRAVGLGRFLTTDVFVKNRDRQLAEVLLGSIPGVRAVDETRVEKFIVAGRGSGANHPCYVQVVLDGISIYAGREGQPEFDINSLDTGDVLAVEFYTPATTPPRFNVTGGGRVWSGVYIAARERWRRGKPVGPVCGTLVIWSALMARASKSCVILRSAATKDPSTPRRGFSSAAQGSFASLRMTSN